ncbi:flagellar biosynthetic protein FliR [Methylocapsa palsarum]|uniref:Flagellar biosynthetic protein FliR n=1 Tax=Methylocapsa palsarum TaxID=1612308 RepID=A0A1I3WAF5_9HYPH|nr:flagellar biosynthetic protein FliR [Methylocapsa palsarum]
MTQIGTDAVLAAFTIFCRIGACLMLMPGLSSARVPVNVRLFLAFAVALAFVPLLSVEIEARLAGLNPVNLTLIIMSELLIGATIGFLRRIYFGSLETLASVVAMSIGLSSPIASVVGEGESNPAVASLLTLAATTIFFVSICNGKLSADCSHRTPRFRWPENLRRNST